MGTVSKSKEKAQGNQQGRLCSRDVYMCLIKVRPQRKQMPFCPDDFDQATTKLTGVFYADMCKQDFIIHTAYHRWENIHVPRTWLTRSYNEADDLGSSMIW